MSFDFLAVLAIIREESNGDSRVNSDQESDVSEAAANKAFLEKDLKSKLDLESNTLSNDKSKDKKSKDNESKNDEKENDESEDDENNFIATLLQVSRKSKFANCSTLLAREKLVWILNGDAFIPKQQWRTNRILTTLTSHRKDSRLRFFYK